MRVMVLDDHKEFCDEVVGMLARNGHEGVGATSADEAVALVGKGNYDFVLVDFSMPKHDGLWFLKNARLPRRTKALLVTAHVSPEIINHMFKSGAAGYLIKPFDEADLMRHLEFHAHREAAAGGAANPAPEAGQAGSRDVSPGTGPDTKQTAGAMK
ncbi:MAG: hypothetical protein C0404_03240 [Verrucomicrobia bacterium]|nr:hypothetical protein [Verrucomicrobiota bacterium]